MGRGNSGLEGRINGEKRSENQFSINRVDLVRGERGKGDIGSPAGPGTENLDGGAAIAAFDRYGKKTGNTWISKQVITHYGLKSSTKTISATIFRT